MPTCCVHKLYPVLRMMGYILEEVLLRVCFSRDTVHRKGRGKRSSHNNIASMFCKYFIKVPCRAEFTFDIFEQWFCDDTPSHVFVPRLKPGYMFRSPSRYVEGTSVLAGN